MYFSSFQAFSNTKEKDISDEMKTIQHIRSLKPGEAIQQIERGWKSGAFPASEAVVKEYLKSAAALKKLDSLNVINLLNLIQKNGNMPMGSLLGSDVAGTMPSTGNMGNMTPEAMFAAIQSMPSQSTAGSTMKDPIYVRSKYSRSRYLKSTTYELN
jgi:hypothetical protein